MIKVNQLSMNAGKMPNTGHRRPNVESVTLEQRAIRRLLTDKVIARRLVPLTSHYEQ